MSPLRFSSVMPPGLSRASTPSTGAWKDVDGRDEPGHDDTVVVQFRNGSTWMRPVAAFAFGAALLALAAPASAQMKKHHHAAEASCPEARLACAKTATPTFGADGRLWLAWASEGKVMVASSADLGRSFGAPVPVDKQPAKLDWGPDSRPRIVVDRAGRIVVAYTIFKDDKFNGEVLVTRSTDGGASFAPPRPLSDDAASQRFVSLAEDPAGGILAAWIDKRNATKAKRAGEKYPGAALAYARSADGGETYETARIAIDNSCECCRIGLAFAGPGRAAAIFRNVFEGGVRDHAVVTFENGAPGPLHRVSVDAWMIDGCPHHGPGLAVAADGTNHATRFTDGSARQGAFYARSTDGGKTFSAPLALGSPDRQAGRAHVLAAGSDVWVAWQEFDGDRTTILTRVSHDNGATWSAPAIAAETKDEADHPLLVGDGRRVFLSWLSKDEGYRLISLGDAS